MKWIARALLALGLATFFPSLASAQCNGAFPNNTVCGNSSGAAAPPFPISTTILSCSGVAASNSDNSTAIQACITAANAANNTAIYLPPGVLLAPNLAATVTGSQVWIVCQGGPGDCILKGSQNGVLTWTGNYGGTFNMGFDNAGAATNTTLSVASASTMFINSWLGTGIGVFAAANGVGFGSVTFEGTFGAVGATVGVPLFAFNFGNGMIIRNSQIATTGTRGSVVANRDFIQAETGSVGTLRVDNNLVQVFDHPFVANAANGITSNDFIFNNNTFDGMNNGFSLIAQAGGTLANFTYADKWFGGGTTTGNGPCMSFTGAGIIQTVWVDGHFLSCGSSGIIATATTFKHVHISIVSEGVNAANAAGTADFINIAGGANYSYIEIVNSVGGFSGFGSAFQAKNGCVFGAAIDHLTFIGNDCTGSTANYNGMAAGTSSTFAHTNYKQRSNIGLIDSPVYAITEGGTNCSVASGTCLDNITGFASTGFLKRTGAGTYSFVTDPSDVTSVFGRTGAVVAAANDYNFNQLAGTNSIAQLGGSGASHATLIDVAGTATWKVIPDCQDSSGNHINYTQSTDAFSCGTTVGALAAGNFANPTAKVGPTATNGSATTAMRSDGAPAIDLTASYSWTSPHTFTIAAGGTAIALHSGGSANDILTFTNDAVPASNKWTVRIRNLVEGDIGFWDTNSGTYGLYVNGSHAVVIGGSTTFAGTNGELGFPKITASGTAPGAGNTKVEWTAGTNAGTCKMIAYAGTSTTPVTIVDNVGTGC
jgi:hypothetical protein